MRVKRTSCTVKPTARGVKVFEKLLEKDVVKLVFKVVRTEHIPVVCNEEDKKDDKKDKCDKKYDDKYDDKKGDKKDWRDDGYDDKYDDKRYDCRGDYYAMPWLL